jgi:hypothetical protein
MKVKYQFSLTLIERRQWWCNLGVMRRKTYFCFYCVTSRDVTWCMSLVTISHAKLQNKRYLTTTPRSTLSWRLLIKNYLPTYSTIFLYFLLHFTFCLFRIRNQSSHKIWISSTFFVTLCITTKQMQYIHEINLVAVFSDFPWT